MSQFRWPYPDDRRWPEELLRAFMPQLNAQPARSAGVFPPINLYDDGTAFLVRTELPGIERDTLEVSVKGDQLTLGGERKLKAVNAQASYHRRETDGGQFRRAVTLPQAVDPDKITATYKNGVLEVLLSRIPEVQPRKIAIN